MPYVTQVLLPKYDNLGRRFRRKRYFAFHLRMIFQYGGWTRKGQAEGSWLSASGELMEDEHWIYEIGHDKRDQAFWEAEKETLKTEFEQEEIWIMQYEGRRI